MSDLVINASVPLDDDRYLRRECPHCIREFKIKLSEEELTSYLDKHIASFLTDEVVTDEDADETKEFYCPYCKQTAPNTHWWTQEQLSYLEIFGKNILAKIVNENLIKPLKRTRTRKNDFISITFDAKEMVYEDPWISEEINDMVLFDLPCCGESIKIQEGLQEDVCCYYCGFIHGNSLGV